jgi:hypothetical protein
MLNPDHRRYTPLQQSHNVAIPLGGPIWSLIIFDALGVLFYMYLGPRLSGLLQDPHWWIALIFLAVYLLVCAGSMSYRQAVQRISRVLPNFRAPHSFDLSVHLLSVPYGVFAACVFCYYFGLTAEIAPGWQLLLAIIGLVLALLYPIGIGTVLEEDAQPLRSDELVSASGLMQLFSSLHFGLSMAVWLTLASVQQSQGGTPSAHMQVALGWLVLLLLTNGLPRLHIALVERDGYSLMSYLLVVAFIAWDLASRGTIGGILLSLGPAFPLPQPDSVLF